MRFSDIISVTIPEGEVIGISKDGNVLWQKITLVNRWNLKDRTEFIGVPADGMATMYFDSMKNYTQNTKMPMSETVWYNSGRRIGDGVFYSTVGNNPCTLSNITEDGLTFKSGRDSDMFIAIPFHINSGETFSISYYTSGTNRSGYMIFAPDGTYKSQALDNKSGAGNKTFTYTATEECWLAWQIGKYDANSSVTLSDIILTIG